MFRLLLSASKKVLRDDEIVKSVAADRERAQGLSEDCDMANFKLPLNSFHVIPQWFEEHPTSETKFCKVGSINLEQYLSLSFQGSSGLRDFRFDCSDGDAPANRFGSLEFASRKCSLQIWIQGLSLSFQHDLSLKKKNFFLPSSSISGNL